jgi:hypothetical protein
LVRILKKGTFLLDAVLKSFMRYFLFRLSILIFEGCFSFKEDASSTARHTRVHDVFYSPNLET